MPLPTPETAERMNSTVRTAMIVSAMTFDSPVPQRKLRPLLICCAPRPSEVAVPKSVAMIARMSIALPIGPWARVAQQRREGARDQHRQALAVAEVGDGEAGDGVDRPRVQRPVEVGILHREQRRLAALRRGEAVRRRAEVRDRLGDAPEHQPDAHADAEHHADPGDGGELRLVVVVPELDVAEAAHREEDREDEEDRGRDHEGPAEAVDDEAEDGAGDGGEAVGRRACPRARSRRRRRPTARTQRGRGQQAVSVCAWKAPCSAGGGRRGCPRDAEPDGKTSQCKRSNWSLLPPDARHRRHNQVPYSPIVALADANASDIDWAIGRKQTDVA